jgi:hypothetical protein
MKILLRYCMVLGSLMLVLLLCTGFSGRPSQDYMKNVFPDRPGSNPQSPHQVPEPMTLTLLGLGAAGTGILYALKRNKRK